MGRSMLRYREDRRSLAFVCAFPMLAAVTWRFIGVAPFIISGALVSMLAVLSWICAVITHNALHCPIWKSRTLNNVTQVALSLAYGFPVTEYIPGHNLSHHRYLETRRDVMRTSKVRFHWNWINLMLFFPIVGIDVIRANAAYARFARGKNKSWDRQHGIETAATWGVTAALALVDWKRALTVVLFPHLFAVWGITTVNFLWHDGCDPNHSVNHSRNFVGKLFNYFTFNNGFHGIHHMHPGLHWSLLPAAHAREVAPTIHPALEQRSLTVYLVRAFIYPGRRLRYDGAPAVLPADGPDEDWIGGNGAADPSKLQSS